MKISKAHQKLSDRLNNSRVLTNPEEFLGPNWKDVLNFWLYLDKLSEEQLRAIEKCYFDIDDDERYDAYIIAKDAAKETTFYWSEACLAVYFSHNEFNAAVYATYELIGSHKILDQQKSLTFLKLFQMS